MENKIKLGPIGDYPEGKLTNDDEGGLRIGIVSFKGKIVIDFGEKPITWLGLNPIQACVFGETIKTRAIEAARENGIPEADFLRAVELLTKRSDDAKN